MSDLYIQKYAETKFNHPYCSSEYLINCMESPSKVVFVAKDNKPLWILLDKYYDVGGIFKVIPAWIWPDENINISLLIPELINLFLSKNYIAGYLRFLSSEMELDKINYRNTNMIKEKRKWYLIENPSSWVNSDRSLRNSFNSFKTNGGFISLSSVDDINEISSIYNKLSNSKNFSKEYQLTHKFINHIILSTKYLSLSAYKSDNTLCGFSVFSLCNDQWHYMYSATDRSIPGISASLIKNAIYIIGNSIHNSNILLGSGNTEGDGLSKFKEKFSTTKTNMYHFNLTLDEKKYHHHVKSLSNHSTSINERFPIGINEIL